MTSSDLLTMQVAFKSTDTFDEFVANYLTLINGGSAEYRDAVLARVRQSLNLLAAVEQAKGLTFTPSDFHNLPCKPMRIKK